MERLPDRTGDVAIIAQAASSQGGAGYYTVGCANNPAPPTPYPGNTLCFGIPGDGNAYDSLVGGALNMSGNFPAIPGGTYNLYAHYAGDTTYGASNSQLVQVTVAPEITTLEVDPYYLPATGNAAGVLVGPPVTSFLYGQNVYPRYECELRLRLWNADGHRDLHDQQRSDLVEGDFNAG